MAKELNYIFSYSYNFPVVAPIYTKNNDTEGKK